LAGYLKALFMSQKRKILVVLSCLSFICSFCYSFDAAEIMTYMDEKLLSMQDAKVKWLEKNMPELFQYEQKILEIRKEVRKILNDFQQKKANREDTTALLEPLLKQERGVLDNPDYKTKRLILDLLTASSFQKKTNVPVSQ